MRHIHYYIKQKKYEKFSKKKQEKRKKIKIQTDKTTYVT